MTSEETGYLLAADLVTSGTRRFVWLVLDRACSKGIGWGYLTSLGRQLGQAPEGEAA